MKDMWTEKPKSGAGSIGEMETPPLLTMPRQLTTMRAWTPF